MHRQLRRIRDELADGRPAEVLADPLQLLAGRRARPSLRRRSTSARIGQGAVFADDAERFAAAVDAIAEVPALVTVGVRRGAWPLAS
jgi:hypothetical protein